MRRFYSLTPWSLAGMLAPLFLLGSLGGCGGGDDTDSLQSVTGAWTQLGFQSFNSPLDTTCTRSGDISPCLELDIDPNGVYTLKPSRVSTQPSNFYYEERGTWAAQGGQLLLTQTELWVDYDRNGVRDEESEVAHSLLHTPKYEFDAGGSRGNLYTATTEGFNRSQYLVFGKP